MFSIWYWGICFACPAKFLICHQPSVCKVSAASFLRLSLLVYNLISLRFITINFFSLKHVSEWKQIAICASNCFKHLVCHFMFLRNLDGKCCCCYEISVSSFVLHCSLSLLTYHTLYLEGPVTSSPETEPLFLISSSEQKKMLLWRYEHFGFVLTENNSVDGNVWGCYAFMKGRFFSLNPCSGSLYPLSREHRRWWRRME